jgi:hypothetical protein
MKPSANTFKGVIHPSILSHKQGDIYPINDNIHEKSKLSTAEKLRGTSEKPRGTFQDDTTPPARLQHFHNFYHIKRADLINGRYLPADRIQEETKRRGAKVVVLAVGMGGGKTEQYKTYLHNHHEGRGIMLSHRAALAKNTAERLEVENYQNIKAARIGGNACKAYASTIHSQHQLMTIERIQEALAGGLVGLDESESIAAEFLNTTIRNEPLVLDALRKTAKRADTVMMMDAHAGAGTAALLRAFGYRDDEILLVTADVKEFSGYRARIFQEAEGKTDLKTAFMGRILADLQEGKKVIVTSLSKSALDELEKHAAGKIPNLKYIKVTSDTSGTGAASKLNAETYADYQLVMLSPSMSTGISFDKHHADSAYCFAVNASETGTPYDGLQAMLRDRAVKSRVLNIYYQHIAGMSTVNTVALGAYNQERAFMAVAAELPEEYRGRFEALRPDAGSTFAFLRDVAVECAGAKADFLPILESELKAKGAAVEYCGIDALDNSELTRDERKEVKAQAAEERLQGVESSPAISSMEVDALKSTFANNQEKRALVERLGLDTPGKVRAVLVRHFIEKETACNLDALPPADRRELLVDVLDNALVSKLREWDLVRAKPADLKRIQKAAVAGVQADDFDEPGFVEKVTSDRVLWVERAHYGRMVLQAVGIGFDESGVVSWDGDELLTDARIRNPRDRGHALFKASTDRAKQFIESGLLPIQTIPFLLKKHPAEFLRKALERYGVKLRKMRGSNPVEYRVETGTVQRLVDLVNGRMNAGRDTVAERLARIDEYLNNAPVRKERAARRFADFVSACPAEPATSSEKSTHVDGATLIRSLWAECGRTDDVSAFLAFFAGDLKDFEAGIYPLETLKMVVREWGNKGQYTNSDKSNT